MTAVTDVYAGLVLIDDRLPPSSARRSVEPNWRCIGWLAAAGVLAFAGAHTDGLLAYLFICAVVYTACRAAAEAIDLAGGMHDWRQ